MKENNVSEIVKVQDAIMLEIEELDDLDLVGVTGGYKMPLDENNCSNNCSNTNCSC